MIALGGLSSEIDQAVCDAVADRRVDAVYQPFVNLVSGVVGGFEVLARWTDPFLSEVQPCLCIEITEHAGLITLLTEALLRKACSEAVAWPGGAVLAFNLSPVQLLDRQLGLRIFRILLETGFPPHRLEVEVTESAIISDNESAEFVLTSLADAGVGIALDDFGTGYSSLEVLGRFRFTKLKIDRRFVSFVSESQKAAVIARAIVGLGRSLGLATVAEGVENDAQLEFFKESGCDFGQGYRFSPALPAAGAMALASAQVEARAGVIYDIREPRLSNKLSLP